MSKKKRFLHFPQYPGGKDEIKTYISDNLVYPEVAIREKVSGTVYLSAEVDDNGRVTDISVEKGIGYGCDEEAVRLISGLRYGGVHNRGLRLRVRHRFRIRFDLAGYLRKKSSKTEGAGTGSGETPNESSRIVYNYTNQQTDKSVQQKIPEKENPAPGKKAERKFSYTIQVNRNEQKEN